MVAAAAIRLIGDLGVGDLAAGEGASDSSGGSPNWSSGNHLDCLRLEPGDYPVNLIADRLEAEIARTGPRQSQLQARSKMTGRKIQHR